MELPKDNTLLAYLVLSTKRAPTFPFLLPAQTYFHSPEGSVHGNGTLTCTASERHDFFQPEHGRRLTLLSSRGYSEQNWAREFATGFGGIQSEQEDSFAQRISSKLPSLQTPNSLICLIQESPYFATVFSSMDLDLRMYGLYTQDTAMLVLTNLQNYEQMLTLQHREEYWLYRFLPRNRISFALFPRRLCARWFRWGQQTNLHSFPSRFTVLERHICKDRP